MSETSAVAVASGQGFTKLRHDVWARYAVSLLTWAVTAGFFYRGLLDAQETMKIGMEKVTTQQQQIVDQLFRLTNAEETLAEHVRSADLRQADDHHRIERLEDGKSR